MLHKMKHCTFSFFITFFFQTRSCHNDNIKTTLYIIIIKTKCFTYKSRKSVPDDTVPDLFTHRYSKS